jgi:hypothetical protein
MFGMVPGQMVILREAPPALLSGLPPEDQEAILDIVGRPVEFSGYSFGQAEIEFIDRNGDGHSLWVEPSLLSVA